MKKDGSTIVCRVVEVSATEITYKKWSDLNGSNYVMDKSLASAINYENGKKENLSEATNLYAPGNQNDGVQQYNDRALLRIDAASNNPYTKVKASGKVIVKPEESVDFLDRNASFPYKIEKGDLCYRLFKAHGFRWGGEWASSKDYQHFER